jgi:hypothetical protein
VVAVHASKGWAAARAATRAARFESKTDETTDIVHVFSTKTSELESALASYLEHRREYAPSLAQTT